MSSNSSDDFLWHIPGQTRQNGPGMMEQLRNPIEQVTPWTIDEIRRQLEGIFSEQRNQRRDRHINIITDQNGLRLFDEAIQQGLDEFLKVYKPPLVEFEGYEWN
jgi:hypothetical protein